MKQHKCMVDWRDEILHTVDGSEIFVDSRGHRLNGGKNPRKIMG